MTKLCSTHTWTNYPQKCMNWTTKNLTIPIVNNTISRTSMRSSYMLRIENFWTTMDLTVTLSSWTRRSVTSSWCRIMIIQTWYLWNLQLEVPRWGAPAKCSPTIMVKNWPMKIVTSSDRTLQWQGCRDERPNKTCWWLQHTSEDTSHTGLVKLGLIYNQAQFPYLYIYDLFIYAASYDVARVNNIRC